MEIHEINNTLLQKTNNHEGEQSLEDRVTGFTKTDTSLAFLIMYEEWKANIVLSDGSNEDENLAW